MSGSGGQKQRQTKVSDKIGWIFAIDKGMTYQFILLFFDLNDQFKRTWGLSEVGMSGSSDQKQSKIEVS